jgi:hypothetical protein
VKISLIRGRVRAALICLGSGGVEQDLVKIANGAWQCSKGFADFRVCCSLLIIIVDQGYLSTGNSAGAIRLREPFTTKRPGLISYLILENAYTTDAGLG